MDRLTDRKQIALNGNRFQDVVYTIRIKKEGWLKKNSEKSIDKQILKGVTGMVLPGELLAMLGPSGCGKTMLLTALGGRLGGELGGTVTYNGKQFSSIMKRNIGFITQDDVLYPHLTVTETLMFTALLRLPSGERKRVSIGQEMLINPSLLFLDEQISRLDSTIAERIVSTLWDLARGGRTVVMTIHQPSSRLFYMFHKSKDREERFFGEDIEGYGESRDEEGGWMIEKALTSNPHMVFDPQYPGWYYDMNTQE
ncbi:hypothetical protein L2E82_46253 [Cichorium intybus]|uniref:Uncharacterized protein n=1 Tax=Cichorium intybus TaxID=13427 RepID=A0ACB8YTG7_CICIN|nr:hypothetical protein L2E82_46253 [Cichorium intybus]